MAEAVRLVIEAVGIDACEHTLGYAEIAALPRGAIAGLNEREDEPSLAIL